jgi:hypothetical protein
MKRFGEVSGLRDVTIVSPLASQHVSYRRRDPANG